MILLRFLKIMHRGGANVLLNDQTVGPTRTTTLEAMVYGWCGQRGFQIEAQIFC